MTAIVKCVSISPREDQFIKKHDYSASKLLQFSIMKLMENEMSKGQDSWSKPSDEPLDRGSNIE